VTYREERTRFEDNLYRFENMVNTWKSSDGITSTNPLPNHLDCCAGEHHAVERRAGRAVSPVYAPAQAQEDDDATPTPSPTPAPPLVELNEEVIKRATVYLMQTYQNQNQPIISCVGSGTLISADGLILTNAHTALSSETCRSDRIVIAVTVRLDEPPVPTYTAEVIEASEGLNLAVLRISGIWTGAPSSRARSACRSLNWATPTRLCWMTRSRSSAILTSVTRRSRSRVAR
jgi:hypothetical protein